MANENSNVVVDRAQSHWSDLWKKEDYWAIWLGFALLIAAICIFINGAPASYKETIDKSNAIMKVEAEKAPFKTIAYIQAQDAKKGVVGTNLPIAKEIKAFIASPGKWTDNPVKSMFTSQAEADAKNAANKEKAEAAKAKAESSFAAAQAAEKLAADAGYKDASLNTAAEAAIKDWTKAKADASKASAKAKPVNLFTTLPLLMVAFALFFGIGIFVMGQNLPKFLIGFVGLFVVVVIAMILGKQSTMAYYGIGVEPWGIMFGMIIANTIGTPQWMKPALQVEYFIKTASCSSARKSCSTRSSPSAPPVSSCVGGHPHRAHHDLHLRPEGPQDGFPDPEHHHLRRHVRVRHLRRHRRSRRVPRQEGRAYPRPRPVHDLYRHHDGGPARLHQVPRPA